MAAIRVAASLLVLLASGLAIHRWAYLPVRTTHRLFYLKAQVEQNEALPEYEAAIRARRDLAEAKALIEQYPLNVGLYPIAARNAWLLGRHPESIYLCEKAIEYERRPEILLMLGTYYCRSSRREEAVQALSAACTFAPHLRWRIPGDCPVPEVHTAAARREATAGLRGKALP